MTPTTVPLAEVVDLLAYDRAVDVLRLLSLRAAQPANVGVDRAVVRLAARRLLGGTP